MYSQDVEYEADSSSDQDELIDDMSHVSNAGGLEESPPGKHTKSAAVEPHSNNARCDSPGSPVQSHWQHESDDNQPHKKKKKTTRKPQKTLKDMLDGLVQGVCTPHNNDVFQKALRLPTISQYPFATNTFEVVRLKQHNTCIINLGKTQTVEHTDDINRTLELGLDLSFEERQLLYNCLDDTARIAHLKESNCYVTLKKLYKDVAVLILGNKEYVAR